jgi:uncharacterized protein YndB with AHSA1/START domain
VSKGIELRPRGKGKPDMAENQESLEQVKQGTEDSGLTLAASADSGGPLPELGMRHETFVISQDTAMWRRWFKLPGSGASYDHDFRVGHGDTATSVFTSSDMPPESLRYQSRYIDIVPARRIVYTYQSVVDDALRWASLATIEFDAVEDGTQLRWTEQVVFVKLSGDGTHDLPHLRGATRLRLNGLLSALK